MPYENFEQLANDYSKLRGNQISEAGWDAIAVFAENQPAFSVIDDCFSEDCEIAIQDAINLKYPDEKPDINTVIPKPELMRPIVNFLVGLSFLAIDNGGGATAFNDMYASSSGMGKHVDVNGGHTALANFNVSGAPQYVLHPYIDAEGELVLDPFGNCFRVFGNEKTSESTQLVVPIKSRQLVLLGGNALRAKKADDETDPNAIHLASTIPHTAVIGKLDHRDLLLVYAVHTDQSMR